METVEGWIGEMAGQGRARWRRALRGGGAMKGGAARSLGENEERNKLPWQWKAVPCVKRKVAEPGRKGRLSNFLSDF